MKAASDLLLKERMVLFLSLKIPFSLSTMLFEPGSTRRGALMCFILFFPQDRFDVDLGFISMPSGSYPWDDSVKIFLH